MAEQMKSDAVSSTKPTGNVLGSNAVDLTEAQDGGVMKEILRAGEGDDMPLKGDTVKVHYVGALQSDGSKFDSSRDRNEFFEFSLGQGSVIKAWDIGVATMRRGELALLVCKAEYAYGDIGSPPNIPSNATLVFEIELFDWKGEDLSDEKDESIVKSIVKEGEGYRTPQEMSGCKIHLLGRYQGKVFQDESLSITVGEVFDLTVVPGVEKALQNMKKGEKAKVKVNSKHAYGSQGNVKFNIPANADVDYEIELEDFDVPKDSWKLDSKEKLVESEEAKSRGTDLFKASHYEAALRYYKRIVELLSAEDTMEGEEEEQRVKLLVAAHLNSAMCNIKLSSYSNVLESCNDALKLDDKNEKGLFRRGVAYLNMREFDLAADDFRATLQVEPSNNQARKYLTICLDTLRQMKEREKQTYRGMFDKFAKEDEKKVKVIGSEGESNGEPTGAASGGNGHDNVHCEKGVTSNDINILKLENSDNVVVDS